MNGIFKYGFAYILGAATGTFVAVKLLEEHYANIADEEIEEIKADAKRRIDEVLRKAEDPKKVEVGIDLGNGKDDDTETIEKEINNTYKRLCMDYTKPNLKELSNKYDEELEKTEYPRDDEDEEDEEELLPPPNLEINEDLAGPYLITGAEFANEKTHYEKLTLWYYKNDKTLADDNEEIIDDITSLIGDDALGLFNNIGGHKTIYIRNEKMSTDFEIICLAKSYKEEILGTIEEE